MWKAAFHTLGCKVNRYDTEAIEELFEKNGFQTVDFDSTVDVYVINTCTVTQVAEQKSRQIIRRARKLNPEAVIAVTGCYAQVSPDDVRKIGGIDIITGTGERSELPRLAIERLETLHGADTAPAGIINDIMREHIFEPLSISGFKDRTRAFLKIQDGCENFCSYCVIPYARGPVRSRPAGDVADEARRLAERGFKEIVLTGIHIASYGKDFRDGIHFMDLVERISAIEGIRRIRIGSIEPTTVDEEFIRRAASIGKLCPHFHVSLQSGCDDTLKRMNRKYTGAEYYEAVTALRASIPDVAVTTDVMVGFPGEDEREFNETYDFLKKIKFAKTHIFGYSPRKGTPAASYGGQVPKDVRTRRHALLAELNEVNMREFNAKFVGRTMPVLIETVASAGEDAFNYEGMTGNYISVVFAGRGFNQGDIVPAKISSVRNDGLISENTYCGNAADIIE